MWLTVCVSVCECVFEKWRPLRGRGDTYVLPFFCGGCPMHTVPSVPDPPLSPTSALHLRFAKSAARRSGKSE